VVGAGSAAAATSLDFGWSSPITVSCHPPHVRSFYTVWSIQVGNSTPKRLAPNVEITAVTDTGREYSPLPTVAAKGPLDGNIAALHRPMFPAVMRRVAAVFEDVDLEATMLHFYVGGLVVDPTPEAHPVYLRVTYRRSGSTWKQVGTNTVESSP
jgi:hypothetical protein